MLAPLKKFWNRVSPTIKRILPKTKTQWTAGAILVVVMVIVSAGFVLPVHAFGMKEIKDAIFLSIANVMLLLAQICISLTIFFLKFFVELAKYNGFIDAPVVMVGWTMVRDVANMFFVVILLVIAFGTILGIEQYEWKKTMVNFIMAAILINFSRLIAGIIIDVAHVFTMTFVNAISATAGGNLISMFHLSDIMSMAKGGAATAGNAETGDGFYLEIIAASVMALVFGVLAMLTMGTYAIVMVARMVVLWALLILSPLAYIFSVIPQTKSYANTWWSEFNKHVLVAPIMVFFLWLGFATMGSGNFAGPDLQMQFSAEETAANNATGLSAVDGNPGVSLSEVSSWENMANFILAIAFLWIGVQQVQKLGVTGGSITGIATDYAKKTAMIASGFAAAKWGAGKVKQGVTRGIVASGKFVGGGLLEATGVPHLGRVAGQKIQQAWHKSLGATGLKREGSLNVHKKATQAVMDKQKAVGERESWGVGALARQTVLAQAEKKRTESELGEKTAKARKVQFDKEKTKFDAVVNLLVKQDEAVNGPVDDKRMDEIRRAVLDESFQTAPMLQSLYAAARDKGVTGGVGKTIDKDFNSIIVDMFRNTEGKIPKERAKFLREDAKEDFDDYSGLSYRVRQGLFEEETGKIKTHRAEAQAAEAKIATAAAAGDTDEKAEEELRVANSKMSKAQSKAMVLYTVAAEAGESNNYNHFVKDNGWDDGVDVNSAEQRHKVMLSLFTGASFGELDTPDQARVEENKFRENIGEEKINGKMAVLGSALDREASKNKSYQNMTQVTEGFDKSGKQVYAFTNNMEMGKKASGTGVFATGEETKSGNQLRAEYQKSEKDHLRLSQVDDARNLVAVNAKGDAVSTIDEKSIELLRSVGSMSANEIKNLNRSITNMLAGGGYDHTNTTGDVASNNLVIKTGQMDEHLKAVIAQLRTSANHAPANSTVKARHEEALIELLQKITGEQLTHDQALNIKIEGDRGVSSVDNLGTRPPPVATPAPGTP